MNSQNEILEKGKHGVSLGPAEIELFLLLFADDLTLLSSTVTGLQNQLNVLQEATQRLRLTANIDKSKVVVFRKWASWVQERNGFLMEIN